MALVYIDDNDPWLAEYEACERLHREIMEQLTLRDGEPRTSQAFASLSANIRLRLKQYTPQVQQLKNKVEEASKIHSITAEEAERRMRQIEQLQSKDVNLRRIYEFRVNSLAESRGKLMGSNSQSAFADAGTTNWGIDDDDDQMLEIDVPVQNLKAQQAQLLEEQDQGLEELSKVISRQKQIAQTINSEVDQHNEIIDDLVDHMEQTDARLVAGTRQVQTISRKNSTFCHWMLILVLFGSIIIVSLSN